VRSYAFELMFGRKWVNHQQRTRFAPSTGPVPSVCHCLGPELGHRRQRARIQKTFLRGRWAQTGSDTIFARAPSVRQIDMLRHINLRPRQASRLDSHCVLTRWEYTTYVSDRCTRSALTLAASR